MAKSKKSAPKPELHPDVRSYQELLGQLPSHLRPSAETPPEDLPHLEHWDPQDARWWLLEHADGEHPVSKGYTKLEDLAQAFNRLDGGDVVVRIFQGQPVAFSQGPERVLFLPDGRGFSLRQGRFLVEGDPLFDAQLEIQDDGFLGPPELAIAAAPTNRTPTQPLAPPPPPATTNPDPEPPGDDEPDESWS